MSSPLLAGGYLDADATTGAPSLWSTDSAIAVNLDLGTLGSLSNTDADTLTMSALGKWSLGTTSLTFAAGADLGVDHSGSTIPEWNNLGDGVSPIIYDTDGTVTDFLLGAGLSSSVLGFAGPEAISSSTITEGHAVLNGLFINGTSGVGDPADVSATQFEGVIAHEFGHMLNLEHAVCNTATARTLNPAGISPPDYTGFPTMYPLVHDGIDTLEEDDVRWISRLYPAAGYSATVASIAGTIRDDGGTEINGINVVARKVSDPLATVVTCVSGYNDGTAVADGQFEIPGLEPDTAYVLDIEQIDDAFTGGSRVGPLGTQLDFPSTASAEFINSAGVEGPFDSAALSTAFVTGAGGTTLSGVDGRLNLPDTSGTLAEGADFGGLLGAFHGMDITSHVTSNLGDVTVVSGFAADSDVGDISFGSGDVDDYFFIGPGFPVEIFDVKLSPVGFTADLYIISWDAGGGGTASATGVTGIPSGGSGSADRHFNTDLFSSGPMDGTLIIGVGCDGGGFGTYTLEILASHADQTGGSAVYVEGTSGAFNPPAGTVVVKGNGFSSAGSGPTVAFSDVDITVDSVSVVDAQTLNVSVTAEIDFDPGSSDITVTNSATAGSFSGTVLGLTTVPVELDSFRIE